MSTTDESQQLEAHYTKVSRLAGDYDARVMQAIKEWCSRKKEEEEKVAA